MKLSEQYKILSEGLLTAGDSTKEKFTEKDADKHQLDIGIEVEYEHTDKKTEATKIALDHLSKYPDYYTKLIKAGLVDEPKALALYKKYYG